MFETYILMCLLVHQPEPVREMLAALLFFPANDPSASAAKLEIGGRVAAGRSFFLHSNTYFARTRYYADV